MDYPVSGNAPNVAEAVVPHVISGGVAIPASTANPVPMSNTAIGTTADAAVTDPTVVTSAATLIALVKGWLTGLGAVADAAWTAGNGSVIALLKAIAGAAISTAAVLIYRSDSYTPISTKTTTQVKSGAGTLCKVIINAAGTADTITIYDALSATGTPIATIGAALIGTTFAYDCTVATGICVVTGGTTAGNYTVTYK